MGFGMAVVDRAEPFADNWAYLKVELNWLEKVLLTAATRQKKENREADRLSKTKADRASSAWWQGLIEVEGKAGHDSPPPSGGVPYGQLLARRLEVTASGKLALPSLCARLELGSFEKSVILMGLAAEVHRRYGQLYEYLCGPERLPTVDLALRLLCRDDRAWRQGRACLDADSKLRRYGLIAFRGAVAGAIALSAGGAGEFFTLRGAGWGLARSAGGSGVEVFDEIGVCVGAVCGEGSGSAVGVAGVSAIAGGGDCGAIAIGDNGDP
jgi:hypothetical protein